MFRYAGQAGSGPLMSNVRPRELQLMFGSYNSRQTAVHAFNAMALSAKSKLIGRFKSQGHKARRPTWLACLWAFTTEKAAGGFASKHQRASAALRAWPNPSLERTSTGLAHFTPQVYAPLRGPSRFRPVHLKR
jgi:hypothetical protein